jgi:peptide/nickel transport system permease protein
MNVNEEIHPIDVNAVSATVQLKEPPHQRFIGVLGMIWNALTANRRVAVGSTIIAIFILFAIFGPLLARYDPNALSNLSKAPPSAQHWLGTTTTGQDLFSQLVYGTRTSIFWGFLTGLVVTAISVAVGLIGGYFGGWVDETLSMLTNVFLVLPGLPLAIVLAAYFPRGPLTIALVITITNWAWGARVLRAQTLSMRSREFVTAALACGESVWRIIFFEIFPNEIGIVAANFVSTTVFVVLAWASLEFLGLGDMNTISWGGILHWAQQADSIFSGLWWWFIPPGLCIALLGASLSLINFGIDEIADPRLRVIKTRHKKAA